MQFTELDFLFLFLKKEDHLGIIYNYILSLIFKIILDFNFGVRKHPTKNQLLVFMENEKERKEPIATC
jgi:hypothetical protein